MNPYLAEKLFRLGASKRNPTLFRIYDDLKESEWIGKEELRDLQLDNARKFLEFAMKNSHFYKDLFKKISFDPSRISHISDLSVLPEMKKRDLIDHNAEIHTDQKFTKVRLAETSGTSGAALSFMRNEEWDSLNRATIMRSYDWYGVKPWDQNGYLWGYNIDRAGAMKTQVLDFLQNRKRLFSYTKSEIRNFVDFLKGASFLSGYSSMIYEIAKLMNNEGVTLSNLKMVKGTSEMILDVYNSEAQKAFSRNVISEYGAAETGIIAFECPMGQMHINSENLHLEVNDDNEAVVTNFASYSFPIIRYNLGDKVELSSEQCACGRAHPVLKSVLGRVGLSIIGEQETYPALTFYYVFKNIALNHGILLNYRVHQNEPGVVLIYIEGKQNSKYEKLIDIEFSKYFKEDLNYRCEFVTEFDIQRKKTQYFVSNIQNTIVQ